MCNNNINSKCNIILKVGNMKKRHRESERERESKRERERGNQKGWQGERK